ncbi:MAG: TIGR03088 family PEP-CTERM/XrtA system glycosyltransferase [Rubrivivax sp.]|nr:TIGR03088 family PEP-CTERM/XrtA system glycosyltransferase [Rubrivivax sp.]
MASAAADRRPLLLHLVHRFSVGGLENGLVNVVNRLAAERWRHVIVALTQVDPAFAKRLQAPGVQCIALNKPPGPGLWNYRRMYKLFRDLRPAVVHTRNLGTLEYQSVAWAAGVPGRVHSEHGRDTDDLGGTNRRHIAERRLYRPFVQQQIALGSELERYLRTRIGVPADRLSVIVNGVDEQRFRPAPVRPAITGCPFRDPHLFIVGTVGRMQPVKAQTFLAKAFAVMLTEFPHLRASARLVMVGEGPLRAECEAILGAAGLGALAWFGGERADVPDVMRGLDCFVLPSLVEGISNTVLEAMASGLPVVATDVGGTRDLVAEGSTGTLVPAGDPDALAHAIAHLVADASRARAMGRAARLAVERRFGLEGMVAAYGRVYESVLERAPVVGRA